MRTGEPMLVVLGELVVDLIPVPGGDTGPEGTAPPRSAPRTSRGSSRTARVTVVDTVGTGDSPAAALVSGLLDTGVTDRSTLETLADEDLLRLVEDAALVAALNCTRVGADPPTRAEFTAARAER